MQERKVGQEENVKSKDKTEKGEVEQENAERKVGQEENVESKDRMWRENTGCRKEKQDKKKMWKVKALLVVRVLVEK